jgi:NAD(P)-dependent dehydrogenase (short-subunit alcohol dehydrogenase family)
VHFAGVDAVAAAATMSEQEWDFVLDVNLKGTFLANQAAFRYLRDNGGRIANVTSPVAFVATADRCHYAASKGGVASLSRALAAEWGRYGITVVALSVVAHTAMTDRFLATLSDKERAAYERRLKSGPLGRVGDPEADIVPASCSSFPTRRGTSPPRSSPSMVAPCHYGSGSPYTDGVR